MFDGEQIDDDRHRHRAIVNPQPGSSRRVNGDAGLSAMQSAITQRRDALRQSSHDEACFSSVLGLLYAVEGSPAAASA